MAVGGLGAETTRGSEGKYLGYPARLTVLAMSSDQRSAPGPVHLWRDFQFTLIDNNNTRARHVQVRMTRVRKRLSNRPYPCRGL
jgi:hypothetical protein